MTGNSRKMYFFSSDDSSLSSSESEIDDDFEYLAIPSRTKKRVQFLAGDALVRIREIPARSDPDTSDDDGTDSSDDDDDDVDDDDDDSDDDEDDDDDGWTGGGSEHPAGSMPVILGNAVKLERSRKGSYYVSKTKGRNSSLVAQIAGVHVTGKSKSRRAGAKDRKVRKSSKPVEKVPDTSKSKHKGGRKKQAKKEPERTVQSHKKIKDVKDIKVSFTSLKQTPPKPFGRCLTPIRKTTHRLDTPPPLPAQGYTHTGMDNHLTSTHMALETMSLDKLYTVDKFIFPSNPSDHLRTRSLSNCNEAELDTIETTKSLVQKKKCFAWKMANGDQHSLLFGTPCILPLWENVQSHTTAAKNGIKTKI